MVAQGRAGRPAMGGRALPMWMTLYRETMQTRPPRADAGGWSAVVPLRGAIDIAGAEHGPGAPCLIETDAFRPQARDTDAEWLRFALETSAPGDDALRAELLDIASGPALLRLDQVTFPPGAIAYRHVHPGPGIRVLMDGRLHLQADDHAFETTPGDHWFEGAGSPVRATAAQDLPVSRFTRFMVLPPRFEGRPSIDILDAADRDRPRLQQTHRFADRLVQLDAG